LALGQWRNPFTKAAIAVTVIGGLADYLEILSELRISMAAPVDQLHLLGFANIGTWTKFLSLAVFAACIAILARSSGGLQKWLLAPGFLLLPTTFLLRTDKLLRVKVQH
jgi:hypothetical protein